MLNPLCPSTRLPAARKYHIAITYGDIADGRGICLKADRHSVAECKADHRIIGNDNIVNNLVERRRFDGNAIVGAPQKAVGNNNVSGIERIDSISAGAEAQHFHMIIAQPFAID